MKQLSFTSNFLLKKIQQSKLIILIITAGLSKATNVQQNYSNSKVIIMGRATSNFVVTNFCFSKYYAKYDYENFIT